MKKVDIVCGGTFGDEGKGQVCAHLALEAMETGHPYGFAVRVGGSNAEHRFETPDGKRHTGRVLPVAAWVDPVVNMVLGAGHIIKMESLMRELEELENRHEADQTPRLFIDHQAAVICQDHVDAGKKTTWRGSTHQGNGQAAAHKVLRDGTLRLAQDFKELEPFLCENTVGKMAEWMEQDGETGLIEGSQGALLSLNHGYYPYCTCKDVTPAALLAEAGISTNRVRHIWAVYRAVGMRVPGKSGPCHGRELSWEELEKALGKNLPESVKVQTDSPTGERERIFAWSWKEFTKSVHLIGPTHMALTFIDWWHDGLQGGTVAQLVENMQGVAEAPVAMVRNGSSWSNYQRFVV